MDWSIITVSALVYLSFGISALRRYHRVVRLSGEKSIWGLVQYGARMPK